MERREVETQGFGGHTWKSSLELHPTEVRAITDRIIIYKIASLRAIVSVWFRSRTGFSVLAAREIEREPTFLSYPLPGLLLAPFFARSLTLLPRSLLRNRTEKLATQAIKQQTYLHKLTEFR